MLEEFAGAFEALKYRQFRPSPVFIGKGELPQAEQITKLISFLAGEGSSFMTGSIISTDGGITT
jgi:NAD(P)-dependent dehydrogenase (short-subunit alcohol dehydrogenase family)